MNRAGSKGVDTSHDDLGAVIPITEIDPWRQCCLPFHQVGFDLLCQVNGILIAYPGDSDHDTALAVPPCKKGGFFKAVDHFSDVAKCQSTAIVASQEDDLFKILPEVGLALGAEKDFSSLCLDCPSRQVHR